MTRAWLSLTALTLLLGACSTGMSTKPLSADAAPGEVVDGLPVRQRSEIMVELWKKTDKGYVRVAKDAQKMADPTSLTVVDIKGQILANPDLKIELNPDSTLKSLSLDTKSNAAQILKDTGTAYKSYQTADAALTKARRDAEDQDQKDLTDTANKAEAKLVAQSAAAIAAAQAVNKAEVAELEWLQLSVDATPSVRKAKEGEVQTLKMAANEKARLAGLLEMPFP